MPPIDTTADGGVVAARLPRMTFRNGPVIRNPRIVTVTFANDDHAIVERVETFARTITKTNWWREVTDSYCVAPPNDCVGEARVGENVHIADMLPNAATDQDIDPVLVREGKAGHLGPLGPDTVLLVYLPKNVSLTVAGTEYCRGKARALHRSLTISEGKKVAYAFIPRCGGEAELTGTASHELLETTTNPNPSKRGFAFDGDPEAIGFYGAGLEPVDPCGLLTMDEHWTFESGFVVHRAWSNRQAALGHDPCVPSRGNRAYLALVPKRPAVRLAKVGDTATIEVDAFADRPVPKWAASVFDLTGYQDNDRYVDVTIDKTTIGAGESAKVTLTLKKTRPNESSVVALVSSLGVHSTMWPLTVMTR